MQEWNLTHNRGNQGNVGWGGRKYKESWFWSLFSTHMPLSHPWLSCNHRWGTRGNLQKVSGSFSQADNGMGFLIFAAAARLTLIWNGVRLSTNVFQESIVFQFLQKAFNSFDFDALLHKFFEKGVNLNLFVAFFMAICFFSHSPYGLELLAKRMRNSQRECFILRAFGFVLFYSGILPIRKHWEA